MVQGKKKSPAKKAASKKITPKKKKAAPVKKKASAKKTLSAKKAKPVIKIAMVKSNAALKTLKPLSNTAKPLQKIDFKNFLTPLDDRLIVQLAERERKTAGGLFIPDTVADVSGNLEGLVVAAGRGHRDKKGRVRPMDVKVGDRVIFPQYSGSKIEIPGADVMILRESDVMGLFQK